MGDLPVNWTYPAIHPKLLNQVERRGFLSQEDKL